METCSSMVSRCSDILRTFEAMLQEDLDAAGTGLLLLPDTPGTD